MILRGAAIALAALSGAAQTGASAQRIELAQLTIRQQIIVRVPARQRPGLVPNSAVEWKAGKKGPKCVPFRVIAGATLLGRNSVDLILRNNERIRAQLEDSCPALDYYQGFYINPDPDGMICADRDAIRSRIGGKCEIDRFRTLTPMPRD
jgi:hypothetical protein